MSAFGGKADIQLIPCDVCFWPKADIDRLVLVGLLTVVRQYLLAGTANLGPVRL
jgi:hypothetical protein